MTLSERFGKLPFADLLQPAIEIAERGYAVPPIVQGKWAMAAALSEITSQPGFAQAFLPNGRAPAVGELFRFAQEQQAIGVAVHARVLQCEANIARRNLVGLRKCACLVAELFTVLDSVCAEHRDGRRTDAAQGKVAQVGDFAHEECDSDI